MVKDKNFQNISIIFSLLLINPITLLLLTKNAYGLLIYPPVLIILLLILKWGSKIAVIYYLNLLSIFSILYHSELVFNNCFPEYIIQDFYQPRSQYYFNKPLLKVEINDKEYNSHYITNSQGFRIGETNDQFTEVYKCDWLFLGDSYTQGAQVEFESLYTSVLYDYFPDKTIINAGISGFGIKESFNYFRNEGYKMNPSKVFLQVCNFNDFVNIDNQGIGFDYYLMHYSNLARFILQNLKYSNPDELPLGRWTEPFHENDQDNIDFNIFDKRYSDLKRKDTSDFIRYFNLLHQEAAKNNCELIIIQLPTKEQLHYHYLAEVLSSFNIDAKNLDLLFPNKFLTKLCKRFRVRHIDLYDYFKYSPQSVYFNFDEHLNYYGHQKLAEFLAVNIDAPSGKYKYLSTNNGGDRYPTFLKNDSSILFQSHCDGNYEIFTSDLSMKSINRITFNSIDEIHPDHHPKNSVIAITVGSQEFNETNIELLNYKTNDRSTITDSSDIYGAIPKFNSTGEILTYAEWTKDKQNNFSLPYIVVHSLVENNRRKISKSNSETWRPIFNPESTKIYFLEKDEEKTFNIMEYDINSNSTKLILDTIFNIWDIAIHPQLDILLYSGFEDNNWDLFLYDMKLKKSEKLTHSIGMEWDGCFSNEGDAIIFSGVFGIFNGIYKISY